MESITYLTADRKRELTICLPENIVPPPCIDCHKHAEGTVTFYHPGYFDKPISEKVSESR